MTDRELDEAVAVHVMGWSFQTFPKGQMPHVKHWYASPTPGDPSDKMFRGAVHRFSTSISAAWQVVERMRELGWCGEFALYVPDAITMARFWNDDEAGYCDSVEGPMPRAICLAALRALGVEVEG